MMSLDEATQFTDQLSAIPPREELDIYSDGHHVLAFSKSEWNFVVKILKEKDDPLLLQRHIEALDKLQGLMADFRILKKDEKVIIIQEKIFCFIDEKLSQLISAGDLAQGKNLVAGYIDFNIELWNRGFFDWHFRINHCGLDKEGKILLFDLGGVRGRPTLKERIKWRLGYFGRKHKKNKEILQNIHPELSVFYSQFAYKKLTRRMAEKTLSNYYIANL